jgi:hypothetical protein
VGLVQPRSVIPGLIRDFAEARVRFLATQPEFSHHAVHDCAVLGSQLCPVMNSYRVRWWEATLFGMRSLAGGEEGIVRGSRTVLVQVSAASRRAYAARHTLTGCVVLAFALTVALTACSTCTGTACAGSASFRAGEMKALRALKLISYFPARSSWQYMWEDFQPGVIDHDMARIAGLHANGVRIIISTAAFGFPRPHPRDLSELRGVIQMAQRNGLRVELTLFDGFGIWQAIQGSREWVQMVLARYAGDSEIPFIAPGSPFRGLAGVVSPEVSWAMSGRSEAILAA